MWLRKVTQPLVMAAFLSVKSEVWTKIKPCKSISSQNSKISLFVFVVACLLCIVEYLNLIYIYSSNKSVEIKQMFYNSIPGLWGGGTVRTIAQGLWQVLLSIVFNNVAMDWQCLAMGTLRDSLQWLPGSQHCPDPHCWRKKNWTREPKPAAFSLLLWDRGLECCT